MRPELPAPLNAALSDIVRRSVNANNPEHPPLVRPARQSPRPGVRDRWATGGIGGYMSVVIEQGEDDPGIRCLNEGINVPLRPLAVAAQ
jgi:hypothetical protein